MSTSSAITGRVTRGRRVWLDVKALAFPLGAYWVSIILFLGLFTGLVLFKEGPDPEGFVALGVLWAGTVLGVLVGQAAALARIRTWAVLAAAITLWVTGVIVAVNTAAALGEVGAIIALVGLILFPMFFCAGLWSIRVNMGLMATWAPLVWVTACILFISQEITGSASYWFAGQKWAIWDVATAPVLLFGVLTMLIYLASRQTHRLHHWQFGPGGPDVPLERARRTTSSLEGCARQGLGTAVVIVALAFVLTIGGALIAPYLWRSHKVDGDGDGTSGAQQGVEQQDEQQQEGCNKQQQQQPPPGEQPQPPPEPQSGCQQSQPQPQPQPGQGPTQETLVEQLERAAKNTGLSLLGLLCPLLFLSVIAGVLFGPPVWRFVLLRHLRRPFWRMSPTERIRNSWRLAEIALGDIGIHRQPGDTATTLATRAAHELPSDWDTVPLFEAAEIADRVTYGLGVDPADTNRARRGAEMVYEAVWELMSEGRKLLASYRLIQL